MKDKIKVTKEQADAIVLTKKMEVMSSVLGYILQNLQIPNAQYRPLSEIPLEDLMKALVIPNSYEVEPQFKDGDKIYYYKDHFNGKYKGIYTVRKQIGECVETYEKTENGVHFGLGNIRHATQEEIKAEKERQLWKAIGREVGEFREGDVRLVDGYSSVYTSATGAAKNDYNNGELTGFYPVESFISFESEESK